MTFTFSYTFDLGTTITGSFEGTVDGNLILNPANFIAFADGHPLIHDGYFAYSWHNGHYISGGAYLSFDGTQNNFEFNQYDNVPYAFSFFSLTGADTVLPIGPPEIGYAIYDLPLHGYWSLGDFPPNSSWTVNAIPEPATWALLLFGFVFVGLRGIWPGATHG